VSSNGRYILVVVSCPFTFRQQTGGRKHEQTSIVVTSVATLRLRSDDPHACVGLLDRWHDDLHEADTWITEFSTGPIRGRAGKGS
jgi:hypothetical protein